MTQQSSTVFEGKELSQEQLLILEQVADGKNLIINAFAGTGKTFTLRALAATTLTDKKGLYIAFNKGIVEDAEKVFPKNVLCRTVHQLAYSNVGASYAKSGRLKSYLNATILYESVLKDTPDIYGVTPIRLCNMILSVIEVYCQSADIELSAKHLSNISYTNVDPSSLNDFKEVLVYFSNSVWKLLNSQESELPITHSVYLKIWALKEPKMNFDYILIDEAQDQNPVVIDLISKQNHLQQIWVGDRYQQIYEFRGAHNALDIIKIENRCSLTQSYRYGNDIAKYCNKLLASLFNDKTDIKGCQNVSSALSGEYEPNVVICRTNVAAINEVVHYTCIEGKDVAVNGKINELISYLKSAQRLLNGQRPQHEDFNHFTNWFEVVKFSKSEDGIHLKTLVELVEQYSVDLLLSIMYRVQSIKESYADIVVSTVHQAKGREWDVVKLADDFRGQGHSRYSEEEGRLLYVAATRAKVILDISDCTAATLPVVEATSDKLLAQD